MPKDLNEQNEHGNLVSLLQSMDGKTRGRPREDRYLEAVETFLSYMKESPKTMLQKIREAKTSRMREELREGTIRKAILYLDDLAKREDVSTEEYAFRSAVIGDFMRLFSDYVIRGI